MESHWIENKKILLDIILDRLDKNPLYKKNKHKIVAFSESYIDEIKPTRFAYKSTDAMNRKILQDIHAYMQQVSRLKHGIQDNYNTRDNNNPVIYKSDEIQQRRMNNLQASHDEKEKEMRNMLKQTQPKEVNFQEPDDVNEVIDKQKMHQLVKEEMRRRELIENIRNDVQEEVQQKQSDSQSIVQSDSIEDYYSELNNHELDSTNGNYVLETILEESTQVQSNSTNKQSQSQLQADMSFDVNETLSSSAAVKEWVPCNIKKHEDDNEEYLYIVSLDTKDKIYEVITVLFLFDKKYTFGSNKELMKLDYIKLYNHSNDNSYDAHELNFFIRDGEYNDIVRYTGNFYKYDKTNVQVNPIENIIFKTECIVNDLSMCKVFVQGIL